LIVGVGIAGWAMFRHPAQGSAATATPPRASSSSISAPDDGPLAKFEHPLRAGEQALEILAPIYTIDKIYKSMRGPQSMQDLSLMNPKEPRQLLWITGLEATMVAPDGAAAMPPEYMCHCNLDIDPLDHDRSYGHHLPMSGRLFTLSRGSSTYSCRQGSAYPSGPIRRSRSRRRC